jgi:hypothetical protein
MMHPPQRSYTFALLVYLPLSLAIFAAWTIFARTETVHHQDEQGRPVSFTSITGMVNGSISAPFIKRRLVPDGARLIAALVPTRAWDRLAAAIDRTPSAARVLQRLGWNRVDYPILVSAHLLIWASALGFLLVARQFTASQYEASEATATLVGALLGIGLLGGAGERWYEYPYDLPNAFLSLLALLGLVQRRWWFWLAFALAAYSKETAVLLIVACASLRREEYRRREFWVRLGAMTALFGAVRLGIEWRFHDVADGARFWYPLRNLRMLARASVEAMWSLAIIAVACLWLLRHRAELPRDLRRLLVILPIMVGLAFFKGWLEERRQYLEVEPLLGLLLIQWAFTALGFGGLLVPRVADTRGALEQGEARAPVGEQHAGQPLAWPASQPA